MRAIRALLLAGVALAGSATANAAGEDTDLPVQRVYDMARPAYDAIGIASGGFLIQPQIQESVAFDDNIFASDTRVAADFINTTTASIAAASQWRRNAVTGRLFAEQQVYASHSTETAFSYGAEGTGRIDLTKNLTLDAMLRVVQLPQARSTAELDATAVGRPIYNTYSGAIGFVARSGIWFNRAEASGRKIAYTSSSDATRSGTQLMFLDRAGLDLTPDISLFVEGRYTRHDWERRSDLRDFNLLTALIGARFQIDGMLDAVISVGALRQDYAHIAFDTLVTPAINADLTWNVTPLTSLVFSAERTVLGTETFCGGTPGLCAAGSFLPDQRNTLETTSALIAIQHEFWHSVLAELRFRYEHDVFDFNNLIDDTYSIRLNARYLINRHWEADLEYAHNVRDANLPNDRTYNTGPYTENIVSLILKAAL